MTNYNMESIKNNFLSFPIIVNISNLHCHLSQQHLEILFGENYTLTPLRNLLQPGQFSCQEKVILEGPKGRINNVRIIGPVRKQTQVEISRTNSFVLGVNPPIRESGNLSGSEKITIIGPQGKVELKEGCIIAWRHIHFTVEDAEKLGLKDKDMVKVLCGKGKGRETIFSDVICRVSKNYATECHLDTDEANAAMVNNGDKVFIVEKL